LKEPKLDDLKIDEKGTRQIRRRMAVSRTVKITINIDSDNLDILRAKSAATGVPYQRLLNQLLTQALVSNRESESRLDRLEKEVKKLKRCAFGASLLKTTGR
jgi:predicted DNA binding CopG/RHH family protein